MGSLPGTTSWWPRHCGRAPAASHPWPGPARPVAESSQSVLLLDGHMPPQQPPRDLVAVSFTGEIAAMSSEDVSLTGSPEEIVNEVAQMEATRHPRWVFWSAQADALPLVLRGIHLDRCWDIAEAHRILVGGRDADPALAWATVCRPVSYTHLTLPTNR